MLRHRERKSKTSPNGSHVWNFSFLHNPSLPPHSSCGWCKWIPQRCAARRGDIEAGVYDTFLLWKLVFAFLLNRFFDDPILF
mmetsp:Transcript_19513/g.29529  ORF Transcript_19513/g.29529 Transcript_19513/m.29529 type:complete len:82 (-) Transcript_19513:271-516(-)